MPATNSVCALVYGLDFTSAPSKRKPITCAQARLQAGCLTIETLVAWSGWEEFDAFLHRSGKWIAGFDFPFGLPDKFIRNIGWPTAWADYIHHIQTLGKRGFEDALDEYRMGRAAGDREHLRATDRLAGAISPQKLYGVPVAKMLFAGTPRLLGAPVNLWPLRMKRYNATAIEVYPGYLVRRLCGRISYKHDQPVNNADERRSNRRRILHEVTQSKIISGYGLQVRIDDVITQQCIDDHRGDCLDAVLAAIHAATFALNPVDTAALPQEVFVTEGWIPTVDT